MEKLLNVNYEHFEVLFILVRLNNGHQRYPEAYLGPCRCDEAKALEVGRMSWIILSGITVSL